MFKRTRTNPVTLAQERKLASCYCMLWYNSTKCYSQIFKLNDGRFSSYLASERLHWAVGVGILVNDGAEKHSATILSIGPISTVQGFESLITKNVSLNYDTDAALALAKSYVDCGGERQSSKDCSAPSNSNVASAAAGAYSGSRDEDESCDPDPDPEDEDEDYCPGGASSESDSNSLGPAPAKRASVLSNEANKVAALRRAATAAASDQSASRILSPIGSNVQANNSTPRASRSTAVPAGSASGFLDHTDPNANSSKFVALPQKDFVTLIHRIDELVKVNKQCLKSLRQIAENSRPDTEQATGLTLTAARGGNFCIDDVTAETPTQFALQIVDRMMGPDFVTHHRFEQKISESSQFILAEESVISNLKAALRARFGQSHWRMVRLALNQASRDRMAKLARQNSDGVGI